MKHLSLFLFLGASLFAALPPLAQSIREIEPLLVDPRLQEWLRSAVAIQEILYIDGGYLVRTQNYFLRVDVEYLKTTKQAGPILFQLHFHHPIHLKTGEVR